MQEALGGLRALVLDPSTIKYVLASHGHYDHVGGAAFLRDRFDARVIMSEADWDLVGRSGGTWRKPKRDIVATDGQRLTLGDTTLTLHLTPGHTLGTISTIIPVRDGTPAHEREPLTPLALPVEAFHLREQIGHLLPQFRQLSLEALHFVQEQHG